MPAARSIHSGHCLGTRAQRQRVASLGQGGRTKRDTHCDTKLGVKPRNRRRPEFCTRVAAVKSHRRRDPHQSAAPRRYGERRVAGVGGARVCAAAARAHAVIRIDAAWFAVEPLDMRAGVDKALARVVNVFGEARAHHAYLFINKRANRMKVLVHDGFGLWLCARKLYEGSFIRAGVRHDRGMPLSHEQLQAIVVGLPWERLDERAKIRVL